MDRLIAARVFLTIIERGSLTAAAANLDMSRSMITRYLGAMEDWAGTRLLHRSTRRISLSPAGEKVLAQCQALLPLAEGIELAADIADAPLSGDLRLACPPSLAQDVLIPVFQEFLGRYPAVNLDLQINNRAVNLIEERIDLAIRITNDLDPNLIARKLGACRSVVCAAPAYLEKHGTPGRLDDLSQHNCLTYSHFGKTLWEFHQEGRLQAVPVSGNLTANDPATLLGATLAGMGIALQPLYSVQRYVNSGELISLLDQHKPQELGIFGVYSSRQHMPRALRAMIDSLVAALKGADF